MAPRTVTGNNLNRQLTQLARLYGVLTSYADMKKRRQEADPESVLLALRALGAPVRGQQDIHAALREKREDLRRRVVQPVIVAWEGRVPQHHRNLKGSSAKATLVLEDGQTQRWPPRSPLPLGYHRLSVVVAGREFRSLVIAAPTLAHFPLSEKSSGVFAPLYALHSGKSQGAGDLADMATLAEWTAERGGRVISTLPLLANFLDKPFEPSPYSPISRLFWNEFYIHAPAVPEFDASPEGKARLKSLPARHSKLVDYKTSMRNKRSVLETLADSFFKEGGGVRREEFETFVRNDPEVLVYAEFRAQTDQLQRGWHKWPAQLPPTDERIAHYHTYVQWIVQSQLRELEERCRRHDCLLYLDLPLGLHRDSFDTWRYPHLFVEGMSGGAPPDPVFTTGQDWAFQPMHPERMREDGYSYTIAYIRNHLRFAKLLRIDHVMGLHRLYWIPEGLRGDRGLYVEYPADEMYAILSLESHRSNAGIVGENLGVVPDYVNRSMREHNVRQLYVAQYETAVGTGKAILRNPPEGSVASLNTHDLFPFEGFLQETDIDERLRLAFVNAKGAAQERRYRKKVRKALEAAFGKNVFEGCTRFLEKSRAGIVLHNLEDFWKETRPQNIPSTVREHANWRRRMRYSMERLREIDRFFNRGLRG